VPDEIPVFPTMISDATSSFVIIPVQTKFSTYSHLIGHGCTGCGHPVRSAARAHHEAFVQVHFCLGLTEG